MTKFNFFVFLLLTSVFGLQAQVDSYKPKDLVAEALTQSPSTTINPLSINKKRGITIPQELEKYTLLDLSQEAMEQVLYSEASFIEMVIPNEDGNAIMLQLVETSIHASDAYVKTLPSGEVHKVSTGKHYRGIIKGDNKSIAAISFFEGEIMGLISDGKNNLVIGRLDNETAHILYADNDLPQLESFECGTADDGTPYTAEELSGKLGDSRALTDCVRLYFEVDYDIYVDKGSNITSVTNYITGLFNQVAIMYANENINVVLSPLNIWTVPSPYNSSTSSGMLNAFTANTGAFDGDLAMLLSYKASGGIAYVNGLCSSVVDYSKSFSSIDPSYANVPTYSWSVMVVTHEFGHLFGSQHTHACVWNGNNTAIDGCYTTEGGCSNPGIPSGGGTVMSYCHLTSVGINLNLGFGPQPGNLIRNKVTNATCTQPCDGGGGGGGGSCTDTEATLTLVLDNYPGETTWTLKNAAGTTLYSGGPYSSAGSTVNQTFCLVDGCYDFQINDSYGDGICCGYGQGSYNISIGGSSVASGGQFNSVEVKTFCVNGNPPPATCTDGVQNGNETGVDCGGPDCPACPTCTDGVQNGGETGIDCGGPNCPSCPTCNDGIQNGSETGIDCGGPDCPSCPTGGGEIFAHFFETGFDGWADGGSDCAWYTGSYAYEGTHAIMIRDNSGNASSMSSPTFNATAYTSLDVNFYFYAYSMETNEDFWLQVNNGSGWQTVATFASGTNFSNNTFYVATVPISDATYNLGANTQIRFRCDASANSDQIYIDAVTVSGTGSGALIDNTIKIRELHSIANNLGENSIEDILVSPNPATESISVQFGLDKNQKLNILIYDMMGRVISQQNIQGAEGDNNVQLDINQLDAGAFFIKVIDEDNDEMIQRFIKIK